MAKTARRRVSPRQALRRRAIIRNARLQQNRRQRQQRRIGPARPRPRRINVQPQRPKKPANGFNLYVQDFFKTPESRNFVNATQALAHASERWRNNPQDHQRYIARAQPGFTQYRAAAKGYHKKKKAARRPGNGYIFFVKHLWKTEGEGRSVAEMGKIAGQRWRRMSKADKDKYKSEAMKANENFDKMVEDINSGEAKLDDFVEDSDEDSE